MQTSKFLLSEESMDEFDRNRAATVMKKVKKEDKHMRVQLNKKKLEQI
jgi:hypothetical protein